MKVITWYLDEIRSSDKGAFLDHFREQEISDNTLNIPFPYTEKDADYWIDLKIQENRANGRPVTFAIRRREDGYLIGSIGFDGLRLGETKAAEIGYWLAKPYWNCGIMSAAVKEACRIGFEELGLIRIQGRVFSFNAGSARVLEKCGFVEEGYLRKCEPKHGEYHDVRVFGLIDDDIAK